MNSPAAPDSKCGMLEICNVSISEQCNIVGFFLLHETIAQTTTHITWDYNWYLQIRLLLGPTYINANGALPRF